MLTKRQLTILESIITQFNNTKQPVSSKSIYQSESIGVSPATVRNEMAVLESLGLISKTHSSSGRIPSDNGYRLYFDQLLNLNRISEDYDNRITEFTKKDFFNFDDVIDNATSMLSDMTGYTVISINPPLDNMRIKELKFVEINSQQSMFILVMTNQLVISRVINNADADNIDFQRIVNYFEMNLKNHSVKLIIQDFATLLKQNIKFLNQRFLNEILSNIIQMTQQSVTLSGELNFIAIDETVSFMRIQEIHKILVSPKFYKLFDLKSFIKDDKISVLLGSEIDKDKFNDFSFIQTTYSAGRYGRGHLILMGPESMPYEEIGTMVKTTGDSISKIADKYFY